MTLCIAQKPRKPDIFCWACAVTIEIENRRGGVRFEESNILNIYIKWGRECVNLSHNKRNDLVLLLASAMPQRCCTASATATTSS